MVDSASITSTGAAVVSEFIIVNSTTELPKTIAEREGVLAVTDSGEIGKWIDDAIAANVDAVETIRAGGKKKDKAFSFLVGQVMRASRGAATPGDVQRILQAKLGG